MIVKGGFYMNFRKSILAVSVLGMVIALSACKAADVVGKIAVTSFKEVVTASGEKVYADEKNNRWIFEAPTGEKLGLSKDLSAGKSDIVFELDAKPFIQAGLDAAKLPSDQFAYDKNTNKITMNFDLGNDKFTYNNETTAVDTFQKIVDTHRDLIGYHEKLDHYGIAVGNGNKYEWAKDISKNDKDIVFVLNPQPFIDAGVDPSKVEGWVFAKVEEKKGVEVEKFLKPFNLK